MEKVEDMGPAQLCCPALPHPRASIMGDTQCCLEKMVWCVLTRSLVMVHTRLHHLTIFQKKKNTSKSLWPARAKVRGVFAEYLGPEMNDHCHRLVILEQSFVRNSNMPLPNKFY